MSPQLLTKIPSELSGYVTDDGLFPEDLWLVMELQVLQVQLGTKKQLEQQWNALRFIIAAAQTKESRLQMPPKSSSRWEHKYCFSC